MIFNSELGYAVQDFATLVLPLSEENLQREWIWKDHDEEGIRFAFFVTIQELRNLAVTLAAHRRQKPSAAQHILRQYHAAYLDLQAALLGIPSEAADEAPAAGEWSVRRTYAHMLGTEINFTITVRYALEKHRAGIWTPEKISEAEEDRLAEMTEAEYQGLLNGPLEAMLAYHRAFHLVVIDEFSKITEDELEHPSTFWEETRFPIRHRLHRYEAHLVQHTVQVDKTLLAIGQLPGESKRLMRRIYAALAEAEGWMIGAAITDEADILATASSIVERTKEIRSLLEQ
jgi:hypothetical protein